MLYIYPDYYKDFKCIADRCPDTCCAGWQIVVDEDSLEHYQNVPADHPFKNRLDEFVDWDEGVFMQDGCRRCAFLNDSNLCDLYTALGEESLCHTCTSYPRHTEEYEGLREVTLSLSCPEVARMVLAKTDKATFYEEAEFEEDYEEDDDFEDFDMLMFGILQDVRSVMIDIMQDRTIDIATRTATIWRMAEELQECLDDGDIFVCQDVVEKYSENKSQSYSDTTTACDYQRALNMFKYLYRLEVLNEDWEQQVDETALSLYGQDAEHYERLSSEFDRWLIEYKSNWQIQYEQIVVYFLATYLCGAVYDGWVAAKVKMSVASIFYIHEMLMAQWLKQDRSLSEQDIINMVYRYSRELEHSDINLDELETCL